MLNESSDHVLNWIIDENWNTKNPSKPVAVFLRFGKFSRGERSLNWTTGKYEQGISVYPAQIIDGYVVLDDQELDVQAADYADRFQERICFVVSGRVSDKKGSDGEPLLLPSTIRLLPYSVNLSVRTLENQRLLKGNITKYPF